MEERAHGTDPEHATRLARLETMIERAQHLPSWPTMAARVACLMQTVEVLTARVAVLEEECTALRQEALQRFWEEDDHK